VTRRRRLRFTQGSAVAGRQLRRVLRTRVLRRGGYRARLPSDRPPAVPAVPPRYRAHEHHSQAMTVASGVPGAVRRCRSAGTGAPRIVRAGPSSVKGTRRSFLSLSFNLRVRVVP
jgi:hypothetical protein